MKRIVNFFKKKEWGGAEWELSNDFPVNLKNLE